MKTHAWYRWIIGILGLSVIIIAHEMGHFLACKLFHVNTPLFSIGFGPRLYAFTIKTTTFQLAALPLGGYVSIDPITFAAQSYGAQMLIMLAGIIFNFLFAFIAFLYLMYGSASRFDHHKNPDNNTDDADYQEPAHPTRYEEFTPKMSAYDQQYPANRLRYLQQKIANLFTQEGSTSGIIGPIGIIAITGTSLAYGKDLFIFTLALLSINIGIFNLLPIPGFDGSQLLMLTIEKFIGPLPESSEWIYSLFFILIALFILYTTFKDIRRIK